MQGLRMETPDRGARVQPVRVWGFSQSEEGRRKRRMRAQPRQLQLWQDLKVKGK